VLKKTIFVLPVLATLIAGCALPVVGQSAIAASGSSNCVVAPRTCTVFIHHRTTFFGADVFSMAVDPAYPPSNGMEPIEIYWKFRDPDLAFADATQGPQLKGLAAGLFTDNYVTDTLFAKVPGPGVGFHWTLGTKSSMYNVKYSIVFQQTKGSETLKWVCDPTIASFGNFMAASAATPAAMSCKLLP
jgi:hypothetical protein